MNKLTAIAFLAEPCEYALNELNNAGKRPIKGYILCCFENTPESYDLVSSALTEEFNEIRALDWGGSLHEVAAQMSKMLSTDTGIQVVCVPMEDAESIEVAING